MRVRGERERKGEKGGERGLVIRMREEERKKEKSR